MASLFDILLGNTQPTPIMGRLPWVNPPDPRTWTDVPQGPPASMADSPLAVLLQSLGGGSAAPVDPMAGLPVPRPQSGPLPLPAQGGDSPLAALAAVYAPPPPVPAPAGPALPSFGDMPAPAPTPGVEAGQGPGIAQVLANLTRAATTGAVPPQPAIPQGPPVAPPVFQLPTAPAGGITRSMTISPTGQVSTGAAPQAPADPLTATMQLLRQKEGLRTSAYYDVNANRVGYGSDTVTLPDGTVQPVNEKTTVTPADAERDLARRSADSMGQVRDALGADVFNKLNPNQVAALTSVAYNYGKVPDRVVEAAKSGDTGKIADAVEGLQTDNKGINADRRKHEANILRGTADLNAPTPNAFAYPNRPTITAPQLPIPGQIQPLQGLDPHAFDALKALAVSRIAPMSTSDRITNVLAGMAGGAIGAKNVGDVLLGAGAGGGAAAGKNIATERGEEKQFLERQDLMKRFQGEVGVREAEAKQQGVNYKTSATNENTRLLNQVKEEQAKLDAAAKNKMEEIGSNFDLQKFQYFMPQAHVTSDGVSVITRKPDGSMNVATTKLNDMKQTAEQIESATKAAVGDKNAPAVQMLKYKALEQQGTPWVKMEIARDMVNNNDLPDVLGAEQYKKLEDEAKKALPNTLMATDPKGYEQKRKDKLLELFWRQKVPDQLWIPKMAERNNFGAIMLMPKAPGT